MYRALYRKWRPQTFEDVVGQKAITTALKNQIAAQKVGHAYLFTGTRGTGKTSCAKIFAMSVNCENPNGAEPCGVCDCCVGLENGSILDVSEIDAASNNSVDDVRALREETAYRPSRCRYRVYIIDEVHMLSASAFNALLKIMEEPPSHVIFILATTEIHKVPATIVSRCQRYDFGRIEPDEIAGRLLQIAAAESIELTPAAADLIARLADGALRDAISLLDTCSGVGNDVDEELVRRMAGVADKDYLFSISEAVIQKDIAALIERIAALREKSIDTKRLTEELINHYRTLLMAAARPDGSLLSALPAAERTRYLDESARVGESFSITVVRRLAASLDRMGRSPEPRIELELALFDLCSAAGQPAVQTAPAVSPARPATQPPPSAAPEPVSPPPQKAVSEPQPAPAQSPVLAVPQKAEEEASVPATEEAPPATQQEQAPPKSAIVDAAKPQPVASGGEMAAFEDWANVIAKMSESDKMLFSFMKNSTAYSDGKKIYLQGGDMFLSYLRNYAEAHDKVKQIVQEVCGKAYAIEAYAGQQKDAGTTMEKAEDRLKKWQDLGVTVEIE